MVEPVFIDAAGAAEILRVPIETVLDLIEAGRLRTFGGRASNPFVRRPDVMALAAELGTPGDADEPPRRVKSASAKVQTRLTADARWADINEDELRVWAARADPARKVAARSAIKIACERLQALLTVLDEADSA